MIRSTVTKITCAATVIISLFFSLPDSSSLNISENGLKLILDWESCQNSPYLCPAGIWTDGVGNTYGVKPESIKTDLQVTEDLLRNITEVEHCVNTHANGQRLPQSTFDAFVSITFNVGCSQMRDSTMFRLAKNNELITACEQFPRWVYAKGQRLKGLVIRREKERELCLRDLN